MDLCEACGSVGTLVQLDSGRTCTVCGVTETVPAHEGAAATTSKATQKTEKEAAVVVSDRTSKDRVTQVYVHTLQSCLLALVDAMVDKGVNKMLEAVVRKIWFRALAVSRCLEPGSMHEYLKIFSPLTATGRVKMTREARVKEILAEDRIHRNYASYTAALLRLLDPEMILHTIYAALVWMQEAITPVDLYLWVVKGDLPYLKLQSFQDKAEGLFKVHLPKLVFVLKRAPSPFDIERGGQLLAEGIGLKLPPVNVPLHIMRLARTMQLRDSIGEQAVALYRYYWRESGFDEEQSGVLYYPMMIPLSCILAAMKLTYGLDDTQRNVEGNIDWVEWAEDRWRKCIHPSRRHKPDCKTLMKMSSSELKDFAAFVNSHLLCGSEARRSHTSTEKCIAGLIKKWMRAETAEVEQPVPKRPRKIGVEFGLGDEITVVPPIYHFQCQMYWFVDVGDTRTALQDNDCQFPIDFVAVLSVMSAIQNVKPRDLVSCLASLEREMLITEVNCRKFSTNHLPYKVKPFARFSTTVEKEHMLLTIRRLGFGEDEAKKIIDEERKVLEIWDLDEDRRRHKGRKMEVWALLESFEKHSSSKSKKLLLRNRSVKLQHEQSNRSKGSGARRPWTENAEELFLQARLAVAVGQPIATLGARYRKKGSLSFSQTRAVDALRSYVSDIEDFEEGTEEDERVD